MGYNNGVYLQFLSLSDDGFVCECECGEVLRDVNGYQSIDVNENNYANRETWIVPTWCPFCGGEIRGIQFKDAHLRMFER